MYAPRWLLPFTYGVDMRAIDAVVRFAQSAGATLVPVSLILVPHERRAREARLEHIQQSKGFLEAVQHKAASALNREGPSWSHHRVGFHEQQPVYPESFNIEHRYNLCILHKLETIPLDNLSLAVQENVSYK